MNKIATILLLGLLSWSQADAQRAVMIYAGKTSPQAMHFNPAFAPKGSFHIGIPALSGVRLQADNNLFSTSDIFDNTPEGTQFNKEGYLASIGKSNRMGVEYDIDLFSIGKKIGENYFHFGLRQRASSFVDLPGDLLTLPIYGNANFEATGGVLDFSGLAIGLQQWTEYDLGWQRQLSENTSVGATVKLLFGQNNVRTSRSDVVWQTDEETYEYRFSGGLDIETSGVVAILDQDEQTQWSPAENLFGFANSGVGIDLGIDHRFSERLTVSASVVDLGMIRWSNEVRTYKTTGEEFIFSGLQITEAIIAADSAFSDSLDAAVTGLVDRLEANYAAQENDGAYSTGLRSRVHIGAEYRVLQSDKALGTFGVLMTSAQWNNVWSPSATVYYRQEIGTTINARLGYTMIKDGANSIGAGLTVNTGPFQLEVGMDDISSLNVDRVKGSEEDPGFVLPSGRRAASIYFGMNFIFGRGAKAAIARL